MLKFRTMLVGVIAAISLSANAATILTVDLSVVDQVTITATTAASSETVSGSDTLGVYLAGIFSSPLSSAIDDTLIAGDLTSAANTSDGTPAIYGLSGNSGLNVFSYTDDSPSEFFAGDQAFSGSATWSISSDNYAALLAGNLFGDVYAFADTDDDLASAVVIGQWEVTAVPVPAAIWLFASALLGFGAFGRKK